MEINKTTVDLILNHSLEEGCEELCGSPYIIKRVYKDSMITWYGENYNWSLKDGNWIKFPNEKGDPMFAPCDEPEYEQLYQRILRKEKMEKVDVRFSLLAIGAIFISLSVYYFTKC